MPAVLTARAVVLCSHGGVCQPPTLAPRVRVSGAPALVLRNPWIVAGCSALSGGNPSQGCMTASFQSAAARVMSSGQPLLLQTSVAIAMPSGLPVNVAGTQGRVFAK